MAAAAERGFADALEQLGSGMAGPERIDTGIKSYGGLQVLMA